MEDKKHSCNQNEHSKINQEHHICCSQKDSQQQNKNRGCCSNSNSRKTQCHSHSISEEKNCCHSGNSQSCCIAKSTGISIFTEGTKLIISAILLIVSFIMGWFGFVLPYFPMTDIAWIVVFLCGFEIVWNGFYSLFKDREITTSLLVSIAILGAILLQILTFNATHSSVDCGHSYIFAAAEIAFLMNLGGWIEARTAKKSQRGIEELAKLVPQNAILKVDGGEKEIPASLIKIGDVLAVRPSSIFPCDGVVVIGSSSADESTMTGESMPVEKNIGDNVFAGTINISGYLEVKALKSADASDIAKISQFVKEAAGKDAPISRIADKWASLVIPLAILCAVLVFFIAKFILGIDYIQAAVRAVTILVVFCPCAFVLATPTAVAAAIGNAAKRGVLIKSGAALEGLSKITSVFFDKTGTLTQGKVKVEKFEVIDGFQKDDVLKFAAAAEATSDHPVGKAIFDFAKKDRNFIPSQKITYSSGIGVEAICSENLVSLKKSGSILGFENPILKNFVNDGYTCVIITINGKVAGFFGLSDILRPSAKKAVDEIKNLNLETAILSGDAKSSAEKIAHECGVQKVFAPLLPNEKLDVISKYQRQGRYVCMVGDGVNDAPALIGADSSFAIASLKNGIAIEAAQISVLGEDLLSIPQSISLSHYTMKIIKINIAFSIIFNFTMLILALFGFISPVAGALLHSVSSICVVLNSARILQFLKSRRLPKAIRLCN